MKALLSLFRKNDTVSKRRANTPMGEALRKARAAGRLTPDTGLFEAWVESAGLSSRGELLRDRMRREYEAGFEERFQVAAAPAAVALNLPTAAESRRMNREFIERSKKAAPLPSEYKGYRIWQDADGWHYSGEAVSAFDDLKCVKRFIDSL